MNVTNVLRKIFRCAKSPLTSIKSFIVSNNLPMTTIRHKMQKQNKINKYKTFNENSNKPERDTFIFYKWS